jgi:tyrosyl-tRNA synthetase
VTELWSGDEAKKAQEEFERIFEKRGMPQAIPKINILNEKINIVDLLIKVGVKSKSEAKRLIQQGAIDIDGKRATDENLIVKIRDGMVIKIGKRDFIQITC